ncbi:hypothetical protein K8R33_04560 [archaeon]|nr:hypothetical protein [archaeon]
MEEDQFGKKLTLGLVAGYLLIMGAYLGKYCEKEYSGRSIPSERQVQQGFIAPNKLEIQCKDLDGNGEPETIIKIGEESYLLRDVDGKPVLSAYEVKPADIKYKD